MKKVLVLGSLLAAIVADGMPANAQGDTTPPQIQALSLSTTVIDTSTAVATVTVAAVVTDDSSGVESAFIVFVSPSGVVTRSAGLQLQAGDTYVGDVTFPQYSEEGIWTVQYTYVRDKTGNAASASSSDLVQRGINVAIGNGSFESSYARTIEGLRHGSRWVRGRVQSDARACWNFAQVLLQRKSFTGWRTIGDGWTGSGNLFTGHSFSISTATALKPAKHRILVKDFDVGTPPLTTCGRATSEPFTVQT